MMQTRSPYRQWTGFSRYVLAVFIAAIRVDPALAEDWGAYAIVPVSAPAFVLEAVDSGTTDGTVVSINKPGQSANQKWIITPKGESTYLISPSYNSKLVLSAAKGGKTHGTQIVLETASGEPWQEWELKKHDSGVYSLFPNHTTGMGLDHLGGKPNAGAKIDIWAYNAGDTHLQWIIRPLAGTAIAPANGPNELASTYVLPELKPAEIPAGEIKNFSFRSSQIFPGTVRDITVFIPAQYDGKTPACVYVKTDGYNPIEKVLLEKLIAAKQMPVTIGVFVKPGEVPAKMKDTIGRRNRCFEYDGVGDNHVRFLVDELLPELAKSSKLKLSTSGNDRCIAGGSSGGIAAFNAAWERPDAFTRVYANSGSFVAFRGGHEFPTLVRKFEAKPIRAFLTTGTKDMENCAGDWFLIDLEMEKALRFSNYDFIFRTITGGHVAGYYDNFPEAMSYIWKDWPEPVKAGTSAPRARDILIPDEQWQLVSQNHRGTSGATCSPTGEVFFVDESANKISRIDLDGKVHTFLDDAGPLNSLTFGPEGELYGASAKAGNVIRYDATGKSRLVIDGIRAQQIRATPQNALYVTSNDDGVGSVWFVKDSKKTLVDTGLKYATGLAYRPDQWLLSVADGRSKWAYSYQINDDGSLANKEQFFWLHVADWEDDAGAESICYAKEGQMLVATRWGIQVCADDGPTQVILPVPDRSRVFGVCLGGRDFDTLFAFCEGNVWKRKVKIHGIGAFSPWSPVRGTPL